MCQNGNRMGKNSLPAACWGKQEHACFLLWFPVSVSCGAWVSSELIWCGDGCRGLSSSLQLAYCGGWQLAKSQRMLSAVRVHGLCKLTDSWIHFFAFRSCKSFTFLTWGSLLISGEALMLCSKPEAGFPSLPFSRAWVINCLTVRLSGQFGDLD